MYKDEEEREQKAREARQRATKKYHDRVYDRISAVTPKGTIDRIKAYAGSVSGFAAAAVLEKLQQLEKRTEAAQDTRPAEPAQPETASEETAVRLPADLIDAIKAYGDPEEITADAVRGILAEYRAGIR